MKTPLTILTVTVLLVGAGCSATPADDGATTSSSQAPLPIECGTALPSSAAGRLDLSDNWLIADVVASRTQPGLLWAAGTNSLGELEVNGLSLAGERLDRIDLSGQMSNVTTISLGPGPMTDRDHLYVANLGTEDAFDNPLVIVRFAEPMGASDGLPGAAAGLQLLVPDGVTRVRAMVVEPTTGDIFVLAVWNRQLTLFRAEAPLSEAAPNELRLEATLDPETTRRYADVTFDPAGTTIAMATETGVNLWRRADGTNVAATIAQAPCVGQLRLPANLLAFSADGQQLYSLAPGSDQVRAYPLPEDLNTHVGDGLESEVNLAPTLEVTRPLASAEWEVGHVIELVATVMDDQAIDDSDLRWNINMVSCPAGADACETTRIKRARGTSTSFIVDPVGAPAPARLEIQATYTDPRRLPATSTFDLLPRTSTISVTSEPAGATATLGGLTATTPFSVEAIVGDGLTLVVEPFPMIDGSAYEFAGWPETGTGALDVFVQEADQSITLGLRREGGHVRLGGSPGSYAERDVDVSGGTSRIYMRAWVALDDWTPELRQGVLGVNGNRLVLDVTSQGYLRAAVLMRSGEVATFTSTARPVAQPGGRLWLRFTLDLSTEEARFFTSSQPETSALNVEWTPLGDPLTLATPGPLATPLKTLVVGQANPGEARPMIGKVFGAAWLFDDRLRARINFSSTGQLTSAPPNYSRWGTWTLRGSDWEYVAPGVS